MPGKPHLSILFEPPDKKTCRCHIEQQRRIEDRAHAQTGAQSCQ